MRLHMLKIDIDTELVIFWSLLHPFPFKPALHCHPLDPSAPISCTVNTVHSSLLDNFFLAGSLKRNKLLLIIDNLNIMLSLCKHNINAPVKSSKMENRHPF